MLSQKQLEGIKRLQQTCEEAETIQLKLNWDMLQMRKEHEAIFSVTKMVNLLVS